MQFWKITFDNVSESEYVELRLIFKKIYKNTFSTKLKSSFLYNHQ